MSQNCCNLMVIPELCLITILERGGLILQHQSTFMFKYISIKHSVQNNPIFFTAARVVLVSQAVL